MTRPASTTISTDHPMSPFDQCHSTRPDGKNPQPAHRPRTPHTQVGVTGRAYWRSLDDLADTPEFREWLEREFPAGASELVGAAGGETRRTFLKLMGASIALAGAATIPGCRRPDHKIMPYSKVVPEETIPGRALYYATSMPIPGGGAEGLLVETHEGRPTKIEGNPLHPINRGKSSLWSQASILGLYDPDRLKDPVWTEAAGGPRAGSWDDFADWAKRTLARHDQDQGARVAFIVDRRSSPSRDAMRDRLRVRWPKAAWISYDPLENDSATAGAAAAFGRPMREVLRLDQARVIVSLDRDLADCAGGMGLVHARDLAATRRVLRPDDPMSRIYAVESSFSALGAKADHRLALPPSQVSAFAVALARAVLGKTGESGPIGEALRGVALPDGFEARHQKWIEAVADDLCDAANKGRSVVVAGASQPAAVHALAHALNAALGNVGTTVSYLPVTEEEARPAGAELKALCDRIDAGSVDTVVCMGVNPVYDAPADLGFAARYAKVGTRIAHSVDLNETVAASQWQLPAAHYLEAWGDTRAADGTIAPIQPMIAPLYGALSDLELLALLAGDEATSGYDIVRRTWRTLPAVQRAGDFEKAWRRALHDGVLANSAPAPARPAVIADAVAAQVRAMRLPAAPAALSLEAVFVAWNVGDGRYANYGWLQEIPEPATRMVWDNAALVSPATAAALGLRPGRDTDKVRYARMAELTVGGASMRIPVWELPGLPENTVVLPLGYGRTVCGVVGRGVGFNTYAVRTTAGRSAATGVRLAASREEPTRYPISTTQSHGSMEGRAIVREVDLPAWRKHGGEPPVDMLDPYGRTKRLNFAERLEGGELLESPKALSIYVNPYNASPGDADPGALNELGRKPPFAGRPQWGMSIDLSTCTGCNVCTVACQAENNIPIVGKIEVNKGREMHWIRVDRYFAGDAGAARGPDGAEAPAGLADSMLFQPVACVQCENAPCETVCPVNATVHGPEGINYMVYNRCIGTRYCANNCPYKVRRFNFFAFGLQKFNGGLREGMEPSLGKYKPANEHLIPPQMRRKLDQITRLGQNPNVTIRSRGVMEKCTYCIQRINEARIEARLAGQGALADGAVQTACQQACPTGSIVFGDLLDAESTYTSPDGSTRKGSLVRAMREHARSYLLLGFLNTRPRTTYMVGVRNPNPRLRTPVEHPFEHHGGGGHGDGHGHAAAAPARSRHHDGARISLPVLAQAGVTA
jgi:molybdopterin-containing oxidoreductase family iron-sulfur binding subunit